MTEEKTRQIRRGDRVQQVGQTGLASLGLLRYVVRAKKNGQLELSDTPDGPPVRYWNGRRILRYPSQKFRLAPATAA